MHEQQWHRTVLVTERVSNVPASCTPLRNIAALACVNVQVAIRVPGKYKPQVVETPITPEIHYERIGARDWIDVAVVRPTGYAGLAEVETFPTRHGAGALFNVFDVDLI